MRHFVPHWELCAESRVKVHSRPARRSCCVQVAIKRIVQVFQYEMDTRRFLRELHILRRVKHRNIIHLLDLFVHGTETDFDELYLVFEVPVSLH